MSKNLNYFTCTLGQAAQYKETVPEDERSFDTVLDLVDKQAEAYGDRPALGFADFSQGTFPRNSGVVMLLLLLLED